MTPLPTEPDRPRRWLGRGALLAVGLVVGLGLAELVARVVQPSGSADLLFNASDSAPLDLYVTDPELIVVPRPGFQGEIRSLGYSVPLRINALGVRGAEPDPQAPSSTLVVGDSFAISVQVPESETFAGRLSASLQVPVYNAGVDGYSTWQAGLWYERLAEQLDVSHVVLVFFLGNDLLDNERFPLVRKDRAGIEAGLPIPREPVSTVQLLLMQHSYLFGQLRVLQRRLRIWTGRDPFADQWRDELTVFTRAGKGRLRQMLPATKAALVDLKERTKRLGDRLTVAIAPAAFQVEADRAEATFSLVGLDIADADFDAPARAVTGILSSLAVAHCDLVPALREAAERGERPYLVYDGHWTPAGHRVVARRIEECLDAGD